MLVAVLPTAASAIAQPRIEPRIPALPVIALETFPSDARTALEAALAEANRNPRDAAASGGLGITLQAWEQWEAAHLAYQRAQVLAPTSAEVLPTRSNTPPGRYAASAPTTIASEMAISRVTPASFRVVG